MTDDTREDRHQEPQQQAEGPARGPMFLIPKSFIYIVGAIVVGSFVLTLFVRNPYTQAIEGGDLYERSQDNSLMLWVAIFIGIPASFYAYKRWVLPIFDRK
jgi:hypothetical protein